MFHVSAEYCFCFSIYCYYYGLLRSFSFIRVVSTDLLQLNRNHQNPHLLHIFFHAGHLKEWVNSTCVRRNQKQQQVSSWVMIFTGAFTFCLAGHITISIRLSYRAPSCREGKRTLDDSINRFCYLYLVTVVEQIQFLSPISLLSCPQSSG